MTFCLYQKILYTHGGTYCNVNQAQTVKSLLCYRLIEKVVEKRNKFCGIKNSEKMVKSKLIISEIRTNSHKQITFHRGSN